MELNKVKENHENKTKDENTELNRTKSKIAINPFYQPTLEEGSAKTDTTVQNKNDSDDKIDDNDLDKTDGKRLKKSCEICHEMYRNSMLPVHLKSCRIYFKFLKKTSKGYGCQLCKSETAKRGAMCHHIKVKHAIKISEKNKENFSKNTDVNEYEVNVDMPISDVNINDKIKNIDQEKNEGKRPKKSCKICNEMYAEFKLPQHLKLCKKYFKFIKLSSNGYCCKFCGYEASRKTILYRHINESHKKIGLPIISPSVSCSGI